jgi:hypothetical protein
MAHTSLLLRQVFPEVIVSLVWLPIVLITMRIVENLVLIDDSRGINDTAFPVAGGTSEVRVIKLLGILRPKSRCILF